MNWEKEWMKETGHKVTEKKLGKKSIELIATGTTIGILGSVGSSMPSYAGSLSSAATASITPAITIAGAGIGAEIGLESVKAITKKIKKLKI